MNTPISPDALFQDAARDWLKSHSKYVGPRTVADYKFMIKTLTPHFGGKVLHSITIADFRRYQDVQTPTWGNAAINKHLNCVSQILAEAQLWEPIKVFYQRLPTDPTGSGHALTADQVEQLLNVAFSRRKWALTAHALRFMFSTGCGPGELLNLRRQDVNLEKAAVQISFEGAKNTYRARFVPMIPEALESMTWFVERWEAIGGTEPDQFLIPAAAAQRGNHANGARGYDFRKHQNSFKKQWHKIKAAALPVVGDALKDFRIYDCRVTAITRTLSDGKTPLHAAERVFGHIGQAMQRRYFKPDHDTLRKALAPLSGKEPAPDRPGTVAPTFDGIPVGVLIGRMKSAGLPADTILAVLGGAA